MEGGNDNTLAGTGRDRRARLETGTVLAQRYRVLAWLGSGGMGTVYEVNDEELDEQIALKLLHSELSSQPDHRQRIRSEVRLARRVSHPNVCRVHDIGQHERQLFVTMELIRGRTLRSLMEDSSSSIVDGPLPRKLDVIVQICAGLSAAHGAGVLHRDVKPDNVIIDDDRAVLTDFGIASLTGLALERRVAGTPAYIAPEVLRGTAFDQRVDVYATAVLAYELITGQQPFYTPNLDVALRRATDETPVPPLPRTAVPAHARSALDHVFARALATDARGRIRTADALAEDIARAARGDEPSGRRPAREEHTPVPTPLPRPRRGTAEQDTMLGGPQTPVNPEPSAPHLASTPPRRMSAVAETELNIATGPRHRTGSTPTPTPTPTPTLGHVARRAEVRVATALHFRFSGAFRAADDLPATLDTQTVTGLPDHLERLIVDLGGTPLDVGPGAVTAVFGAPLALGDDAARATRAAFALIERVDGGRAGIDTARLLYKARADGVPTASGDALNHAEQLAEHARTGQVLASPATARHLVGRYRTTEAHDSTGPHDRVLVVTEGTTETARRSRPPLVGRDRELALLEAVVKEVCETRSPGFATVVGATGFGKSRLRLELTERVGERRDIEWIIARATPLGEVAPLSLLLNGDPRWYEAATREGLRDQGAAFAAARRWLELRAARRPVGLILEDLHWADEASLGFVRELRRTLDNVPVFILTLARASLFDRAPKWREHLDVDSARHAIIELGHLSPNASIQIAKHIAPAADRAELKDLAQRAGGNPFFVEELARDLRERGSRAAGRITPLPPTVEAVVQARLDRLPPREHEVVRAAAVVGREFWRDSCRAALDDPAIDERSLDEALAELERRSIVFALPPSGVDDDRYAFHNALIRDVAYQQLAPRDRRVTHSAVARWLDQRAGGARGQADSTLLAAIAQHRDAAGDRAGARMAYWRAGEKSLDVFAYGEATSLLRRAEALSDAPDAKLSELLGDALQNTESVEAGERAYLEALDLTGDDANARAMLCRKLGQCARSRGDTAESIEWYEKGLAIIAPNGVLDPNADPRMASLLYGGLSWIIGYRRGDNERGLEYGELAVSLLDGRREYRRELARALSSLGAVYMRAGRWRDQLACNQRNLQIAVELRDLTSQSTAHCNLGIVHWSLGEIDEATDHTRRGLALSIRTGNTATAALMRNNLAGLLLEAGQYEEAQAELDEGIRLAEKTGTRNFLTESYTFAARLSVQAGDLEAAERHARKSVDLATRAGSSIDEGIGCRLLGAVLARRRDNTGAEAAFQRAHECLGGGADPYEDARTQVEQARHLSRRGRPDDAKRIAQLRDSARQAFEQLGAARDLELLDDDEVVR
jgi:serine/threonine-protein kinase